MRTIIAITGAEEKRKDDRIYYRTHAILDDGEECIGFGEFKVGEEVQVFLHKNVIKMRRPDDPKTWAE